MAVKNGIFLTRRVNEISCFVDILIGMKAEKYKKTVHHMTVNE